MISICLCLCKKYCHSIHYQLNPICLCFCKNKCLFTISSILRRLTVYFAEVFFFHFGVTFYCLYPQ
jgi:hypothetical protein